MHMNQAWVDETLAGLTLEEKIGQVMLTCFFDFSKASLRVNLDNLRRDKFGGIFHFGVSPDMLSTHLAKYQAESRVPLLFASDYESGIGHMLPTGARFPRPMARGFASDAATEYEIGRITAEQGRALGTHIAFAPVIDVNTEHLCPDVNVRAYGEDVETV